MKALTGITEGPPVYVSPQQKQTIDKLMGQMGSDDLAKRARGAYREHSVADRSASDRALAAPVAPAATGMTWLALRFLPARLTLGRAALLTLAWYLLSAPLMFLALWIVVSH